MYEQKEDPIDHREHQKHHQRHHGLNGLLGGQVQKDKDAKHREQVVAKDTTPAREALVVQDQTCSGDGEGGGEDQQKRGAGDGAGGVGKKVNRG